MRVEEYFEAAKKDGRLLMLSEIARHKRFVPASYEGILFEFFKYAFVTGFAEGLSAGRGEERI